MHEGIARLGHSTPADHSLLAKPAGAWVDKREYAKRDCRLVKLNKAATCIRHQSCWLTSCLYRYSHWADDMRLVGLLTLGSGTSAEEQE